MHDKYQSAEVRDQIDFMLQIYRSTALLYWTLSELQGLKKKQKLTDRIVAVSRALSDLIRITNLVADFGGLAFSKGLLLDPITSLFMNLSMQQSRKVRDAISWRLRMIFTVNFLKRFVNKYQQLSRFKL